MYFSDRTGCLGCAKFLSLHCQMERSRKAFVSQRIGKHYSKSPWKHPFLCTYSSSRAGTWLPSWHCQNVLLLQWPMLPSHLNKPSLFCTIKKNKTKRTPKQKLSLNSNHKSVSESWWKSRQSHSESTPGLQVCPECTWRRHSNGANSGFQVRGHTYVTGLGCNFPSTSYIHPDFL